MGRIPKVEPLFANCPRPRAQAGERLFKYQTAFVTECAWLLQVSRKNNKVFNLQPLESTVFAGNDGSI
ncbi:hypothetical protein L6452_21971 [Arctium lappa]|uniref:Uncharacterized protein n=1 Tax=Arctium lappa TaxID=4217 RepID=A0ACB9B067_ARCLA|nr:hypothetical protein L6452_21971 [Arctium lappa]